MRFFLWPRPAVLFLAIILVVGACKNKTEAPKGPILESPAGGGTISGTLTISPKLVGKLAPTDVLFIIAKSADTTGGPPAAVARLSNLKFPLHYTLSQDNVMMSGLRFEGKANITARISKSGDAMGQMGDLSGTYPGNPATVGQAGVDFEINTVH